MKPRLASFAYLLLSLVVVVRSFGQQASGPIQSQPVNDKIQVELLESEGQHRFVVRGLADVDALSGLDEARLQTLLNVRVVQPDAKTLPPPLLGSYHVQAGALQFQTRFPLNPRIHYQVELAPQLTGSAIPTSLKFAIKQPQLGEAARVLAVYPSADVLPENLLKFYIHFSAPMSRGEAYDRIQLTHAGVKVPDPFLELGEELWDGEQTRFTLFVHPGRIKKGLKPREDVGLPMTDGKDYVLSIDQHWLAADRRPLAARFEKKFRIVTADEQQPNPERWKIDTPQVNTQDPVALTFNESLDHAMLQRVIQVKDLKGDLLPGKLTIDQQETRWSFAPHKPWSAGTYSIEIATNLEDLCGNSLARPFETKLESAVTEQEVARTIAVEFSVQ